MNILDFPSKHITLDHLKAEIGGLHISKKTKKRHIAVSQWLLDNGKFQGAGSGGAVYLVQLADQRIAVKAGLIFSPEAQTQDAVAREIQAAPTVYSYMQNLELKESYHEELCPFHGPLYRRKGKWKKDIAPCHCRYPKDLIVMEFCDSLVRKEEITDEIKEYLFSLSDQAYNIARRFNHLPEIKTVMRLAGRMVFVDFGDPVDLDYLNLRNPRYPDDEYEQQDYN